MPTALIYARISQDREGAGLGVDRQERDCRQLAEHLGLDVTGVLTDNDISAYSGRTRPGYTSLLDAIRSGQTDTVLAWHTDRLHRHPRELEDYIDACDTHGVPTRTVQAGNLDLTTAAGRMVARMLGASARYESEHKSERQRAKHLELARAGKPSGGMRPFGYQPDRVTIDQAEATVIRDAAARLLAGESLRSVAADLNARQAPTVSGVPWSPTVLRAMLLRPRLAGLREHRGATYPAVWPAILPMDTHLALVALMTDGARRRRTAYTGRVHLLSGIIRCATDDTPLTSLVGALSRPEKSRVAYRCPTCGQSASAHHVDDLVVLAVLERITQTPAGLHLVEDPDDDEQVLAAGSARLDEIGREFGDGTLPAQVMRAAVAEVTSRMDAARERLAERARVREGHTLLPKVDGRPAWTALPLSTQRALVSHWLPELRLARPTTPGRRFEHTRVLLD